MTINNVNDYYTLTVRDIRENDSELTTWTVLAYPLMSCIKANKISMTECLKFTCEETRNITEVVSAVDMYYQNAKLVVKHLDVVLRTANIVRKIDIQVQNIEQMPTTGNDLLELGYEGRVATSNKIVDISL